MVYNSIQDSLRLSDLEEAFTDVRKAVQLLSMVNFSERIPTKIIKCNRHVEQSLREHVQASFALS